MGSTDMSTKAYILNGRLEHIGEWDEAVIGAPLPIGAVEVEAEVTETAKGRLVLSSDWFSLREDAYPPLKDQLDAMWKGGEAAQEMTALVQSIKDRYPKTEASE